MKNYGKVIRKLQKAFASVYDIPVMITNEQHFSSKSQKVYNLKVIKLALTPSQAVEYIDTTYTLSKPQRKAVMAYGRFTVEWWRGYGQINVLIELARMYSDLDLIGRLTIDDNSEEDLI